MKPVTDPQIHLERDEAGRYVATSAALPGYVARADTESAALRKMRRALRENVKEQERDFLRLSPREDRDSFRWSRYRTPLSLAWPFSRRVKLNFVAFAVGVSAGASTVMLLRRR